MKPGESKLNRNELSGGRQLRQSTLDRQYLFEMGIDVWAIRNRTGQKDAIQDDAIAGAGSLSPVHPRPVHPRHRLLLGQRTNCVKILLNFLSICLTLTLLTVILVITNS